MTRITVSERVFELMFGLQDGPADRALLAAGRRIGELDPHRLEALATALAADQTVGLVGGLDVTERRQLAALARRAGVDTSDRRAVLAWLEANPKAILRASRRVSVSRGHVPRGLDLMVRRWTAPRKAKGGE